MKCKKRMDNPYFTAVIKNIDTAHVSGAVFGLST